MTKRKKHKTKHRKAKRAPSSRPQSRHPSAPTIQSRLARYGRSFLKVVVVGGGVVAFAVSTIGVVGNVVGIWGPVWPTPPKFSPGLASAGRPLAVPFRVTNESAFFPINDLGIDCELLRVRSQKNVLFQNYTVTIEATDTIRPGETRSHSCPFHKLIDLVNDEIVEAQIEFVASYESWLPWVGRTTSQSGIFTLNTDTEPPQWTHGRPLP